MGLPEEETLIRQLKRGEAVPPGEPKRYPSSHGYIRLRWKVGVRTYVEAYEHRVFNGRVTAAEEVHHGNHRKDDNRPENLEPLSSVEHGARHRTIDRGEAVRLYRSGLPTTRVAEALGTHPGNISRIIREEGLTARSKRDYAPHVERPALVAAYPEHSSARELAAHFSIPVPTTYRLMREYGLPPYRTGGRARRRNTTET